MTDLDLITRLRAGTHHAVPTILGGMPHDQRCLEAADEIERLREELAALSRDPVCATET